MCTPGAAAQIHSHRDFIRKLCIILSYYSPESSEWPIFMAPFSPAALTLHHLACQPGALLCPRD